MTKLLQSSWSVAGIGALLFIATIFFALRPNRFLIAASQLGSATAHAAEKNTFLLEENNPEFDQLISELKKEKAGLAEQAQRLKELELRLQSERAEITNVTQTIHRLQKEFDQSVVRVREEETANLKKLAKTYAGMAPESAAIILKEMTDDQIVKISVFMKEGEMALIFEAFSKLGKDEPRRVALISERVRLAVFRNPIEKSKTK
jgi:flagellar motility protein MotE (MotC chaperone)